MTRFVDVARFVHALEVWRMLASGFAATARRHGAHNLVAELATFGSTAPEGHA